MRKKLELRGRGKKRKNMPGYVVAINSIGRRYWKPVQTVKAVYKDKNKYIRDISQSGDIIKRKNRNVTVLGKFAGRLITYDPIKTRITFDTLKDEPQIVLRGRTINPLLKNPSLLNSKVLNGKVTLREVLRRGKRGNRPNRVLQWFRDKVQLLKDTIAGERIDWVRLSDRAQHFTLSEFMEEFQTRFPKTTVQNPKTLGRAIALHRNAVINALDSGVQLRAAVREDYFIGHDPATRLPRGFAARDMIYTAKQYVQQVKRAEQVAREAERAFVEINAQFNKLEQDAKSKPSSLKRMENEVDLRFNEWRRAEERQTLLRKEVNQKLRTLLTSSGSAQYTVYYGTNIPNSHRDAIKSALDEYAALAGGREGRRGVFIDYEINGNRAYYSDEEATIILPRPTLEMDKYIKTNRELPPELKQTVIHEMAHGLESEDPVYAPLAAEYIIRNTENRFVKLSDLTGIKDYDPSEVARPVKKGREADIWDPYLAKFYTHAHLGLGGRATKPSQVVATEVFSMGFERLSHDPLEFISNHPGHFDLIWNLIRGR